MKNNSFVFLAILSFCLQGFVLGQAHVSEILLILIVTMSVAFDGVLVAIGYGLLSRDYSKFILHSLHVFHTIFGWGLVFLLTFGKFDIGLWMLGTIALAFLIFKYKFESFAAFISTRRGKDEQEN